MGAFQSVPDDVLTAKLAPYLIGGPILSQDPRRLLVVRETCKSGPDLVQLTFHNTALHMPVRFKAPPEPDDNPEPLEMRASAQVVEAMGRVFGLACTALYTCGRSPVVLLTLTGLMDLTSSIVEGISAGRSAMTLKGLCIRYSATETDSPLRAADMLRLLQGCPNLYNLTWYIGEAHQARAELDDTPCEAITELLESRGGDVLCYAGGRTYPEFEPPAPDCIFD